MIFYPGVMTNRFPGLENLYSHGQSDYLCHWLIV